VVAVVADAGVVDVVVDVDAVVVVKVAVEDADRRRLRRRLLRRRKDSEMSRVDEDRLVEKKTGLDVAVDVGVALNEDGADDLSPEERRVDVMVKEMTMDHVEMLVDL